MVSRNKGFGDASACCNSGMHEMAFGRFILRDLPFSSSGNLSGMSLHNPLEMSNGSFSTRATSFMASFVAIVP